MPIVSQENGVLCLKTASYSKSRFVDKLVENLKIAPEQIPNTPLAFDGHVADFQILGDDGAPIGGYGTLFEIHEVFGANTFVVQCNDGKVFISADQDAQGKIIYVVKGSTKK